MKNTAGGLRSSYSGRGNVYDHGAGGNDAPGNSRGYSGNNSSSVPYTGMQRA